MPVANFTQVFCCSSEDKLHPSADLLLSSGANKKWRCAEPGLKSIFVILQFEKATKITGIDIGNEHSAFIEVSVGRNGWTHEEYKGILLSSSFMTPLESRNSTNPNRVRCFGNDVLLKPICDEKWDFLKIMCTQPFNKHVQYGISFVKVHCVADETSTPATKVTNKKNCETVLELPATSVFSQFRIREDSTDSEKDSTSSLFAKWKRSHDEEDEDEKPLSAAAAIRDASASVKTLSKLTTVSKVSTPQRQSKPTTTSESSTKTKDRNRDALLYDDDDINTSNPKLEKLIDKDKERIERERDERKPKKALDRSLNTSQRDKEKEKAKKMEASTSKFKMFLDVDDSNTDTKTEQPRTASPSSAPSAQKTQLQKDDNSKSPMSSSKAAKRPATSIIEPQAKRKLSLTPKNKPKQYKPFRALLDDVVFVISGIQNPERADIREKALRMGARYQRDWGRNCTHLICAFRNTPKYNQVHGQGKIVNKNWILECSGRKRRLPWRRFALDPSEMDKSESEDEIHDSATKASSMITDDDDELMDEDERRLHNTKPKSPSVVSSDSEAENDMLPVNTTNTSKNSHSVWSADTEEENSNH